jgi:hypothetical protein
VITIWSAKRMVMNSKPDKSLEQGKSLKYRRENITTG